MKHPEDKNLSKKAESSPSFGSSNIICRKNLFMPDSTELKRNRIASSLNSDTKKEMAIEAWRGIKKGDMDSLGALYDIYIDELYSYGMGKDHNKARVKDAIHDLFVDIYKYRSGISLPVSVKFYLFKSLERKIYQKQSSEKHLDYKDHLLENPNSSTELTCEEEIIRAEYSNEKKEKLKSALSYLTKRQQQALHLRFTEDRPYSEIAEAMNISIETSRTVVYRALTVLRKHFISVLVLFFFLFF